MQRGDNNAMRKVMLGNMENEIVVARFAKRIEAIHKKTNRLPRLDCVKSRNDKKINVCAEASCDGLQVKFIESNIRGSSLRGFRGFSSTKQGNRTNRSLTKLSAQNPAKAPKIQRETMTNARAGFGMMFAIIITILVATLGVLAVKFSTQTLNTTTNEYIAIQLDLYLNSTAELAILYVQRNGFVCEEGVDCNLGKGGNTGKRADVKASIEKYISYGANNEYAFKYKITPLDNYDKFDATEYIQNDDIAECEKLIAEALKNKTKPDRCFKEETKNAFVLDISGSVANPITHQTLRVTKRQIIKP